MNYRKTNPEVRTAWLKYKEAYCDAGKPSVTSFVAGWNAAQSNEELTPEEIEFITCSLHDGLVNAMASCETLNERKWLAGHTSYVRSLIEKFVRICFKK